MPKPSPESAEVQNQWTDVESAMDEMLAPSSESGDESSSVAVSVLRDIAAESSRLRDSSRRIRDGVSSSIEIERRALAEEAEELSRRTSAVEGLESRLSSLRESNAEMRAMRRRADDDIPRLRAAANEKIDEVDELQSRHVRNLPKIKRELSLHALMTNIKWDYGRSPDVLAGEVSIPGRAEHRRFVIDKEELSEFEIAERLWGMIEG